MAFRGNKARLALAAAFLSWAGGPARPPSASAAWESAGGLCAAGGGTYQLAGYSLNHSVGEPAAGLSAAAYSSGTLLSGYLSQFHSGALAFAWNGFTSTGAIAAGEVIWGTEPAGVFSLAFTNELSSASVAAGVTVTQVYDRTGASLANPVAAAVTFDPGSNSVKVDPLAGSWPPGGVFAVYSGGLYDINGLPLSAGATRYFTTRMDRTLDNVAPVPGDFSTRISIPAGAYASDFTMIVSTAQSEPAVASANSKLAGLPGAPPAPVKVLSAEARDQAGAAIQPGESCLLTLTYSDEDADGIVDGTFPPARAKDLAVWRLDEGTNSWVKLTGAVLDASARRVTLSVPHFSSYALMAVPDTDVSLVHAFPVPFRPNSGDPARYGSWSGQITFTQLPSTGRIRIYTADGGLVRDLPVSPPSTKWDVKNSAGETVASGVYIWEVTSGGNRKTGKLIVIK